MARNISDAILRLDLEVVGLENLKSATAAIERQQRVAGEQRPSVMKTIILVEDLGGTVLSKNKLNWKELQQAVQGATAAMGLAVDAYNRRLNSLLVTTTRAIRAGALNESATRYGLYPPDVSSYRRLDVLQSQAIQGNRLLGAFGSNRIVGSPERGYTPVGLDLEERVTKIITNLARMGPQLGFPQLRQLRSLSQGGVSDENAPELQALIATVAPQIAVSRLITKITGGLRATLGAAPGPNLPLTKQSAFDLRALNPGAVAKIERALQAEGPEVLYTNAATPSLNAIALALTQVPRRRPRVQGGKIENIDDLSIALSATRAEFGTPPEDVKYYRDASGRLYNQPPQQLFATERGTGRRIATSRPKIEDITTSSGLLVSGRTGLPIQPQMAIPFPMTAIETTGREISPGMESIMSSAEAASIQGRGMIPPRSLQEKLKYWLRRRMRQGLEEGGSIEGLGQYFLGVGNEFGMARVGRGKGSISQQAMDLLENFSQPTIFPSVFSKMLNVKPTVGRTLIESMQKEGYLGAPVGTGLASALPVIDAQTRRTRQAQWEIEQLKLTEATEKEAQAARAKVRATEKATIGEQAVANATTQEAEATLAGIKFRRTGRSISPFAWTKTGPGVPPSVMAGFLTGGRQGPAFGPEFFGAEGQEFGGTSIGPSDWLGGGGKGPPVNIPGISDLTPSGPGSGGKGGGGLFGTGRLANRFAGLAAFVTSAAILYPIASTLFQSIGAASQLQTELVRIQAIFGTTRLSDQLTIRRDVITAARELGEDVVQIAQAAQSFAQAGVKIQDLGTDMHAAAIGAKAFGTNIKEVADYIIAIGESSRGRVGPTQAVDLLAAIGRRTNVSPLSLMKTIQNVNPLLEPFQAPAGNIPNEALLGAIAGTVKQRTGVTNPEMALRFAISQLGNPKEVARLERIVGEGFGTAESHGQELRPFIEILGDVARTYQHLIDTNRSAEAKELLRDFFGARQAVVGTTILSEWTKILNLASSGIQDIGAAAKMAGPQTETFSSKFSRLKTDLTDASGPIVTFGGVFVDTIDKMLHKAKEFFDQPFFDAQSKGPKWLQNLHELLNKPIEFQPVSPALSATGIPIINGTPTLAPTNLPKQSIMFGGAETAGGIVGPATGVFPPGNAFIPTVPPKEGKTANAPADLGKELQDWLDANYKVAGEIKGQTKLWETLGGAENGAKIALRLYTKQLEDYYALPEARQHEKIALEGQTVGQRHTPGFEELQALYRTAKTEVIQQALNEQNIKNQTAVSRAVNTAERSITRIQLRFLAARNVEHGPQAIQAALKLIDFETEDKNIELLSDHMAAVKDAVARKDVQEITLLNSKYFAQLQINDVENQRLKMEFLITTQLEDQLRLQERQRQETQAVIGATLKGLQDLPKALEQARAQHKSMLGAGITAIFGPIAEALGGNRAREISEIFKNANFGGRLGGTSKIDAQIQQAQEAYNTAVANQQGGRGMAPGQIEGLNLEIARLKKVKEKQILEQQLAVSGGEIITAVTGGNTQNAQIGGEIGAAAGNLILPGIGGIIGGGLGSLIGGLFGRHKPQPTVGHLQIIAENTREQVRLLENTNKLLEVNFVSFNVPTGFRLPSYQPGSFGGVGGLRGAGGGVVNSNIAVNVSVGGTNVSADKLGNTIAQAISDRLELETRTGGNYFPRLLYG